MSQQQTANQKLIEELSSQAIQLSYQSQNIKNVTQLLTREKRKDELTMEDLKDVSDDRISFKAVGRLFVKKTIPELRKDLTEHGDYCEGELKNLKDKQDAVQKKLGDIEIQLRECLKKEE